LPAGIYSIMWDSDLIYSYKIRQPVGCIAVIIQKFPLSPASFADPSSLHARTCSSSQTLTTLQNSGAIS